jgi:hypothetical protein
MHAPSLTLSSAASLHLRARPGTPRHGRRAPLREKYPTLFDLLLDETSPWETLHEEKKLLVIEILARLIAREHLDDHHEEKSHE